MELTQLIAELTDTKAKILVSDAKVAELNGQIEAGKAEITDLKTRLDAAIADKATGPKQEDFDAALGALRDVTKKVLVASGKVDAKTEDLDVATCVATITETSLARRAIA